jgi:hypothetical protein
MVRLPPPGRLTSTFSGQGRPRSSLRAPWAVAAAADPVEKPTLRVLRGPGSRTEPSSSGWSGSFPKALIFSMFTAIKLFIENPYPFFLTMIMER